MKNRMWIALIGALLICLLVGIGTMAFAEVDRTSYWIVANEGLEYDISVDNYDSENSRVMIGGVVEFDKTLNAFVGVKSKMRGANAFTASLDYPYDSPGILIQKYSDPSCGLKLIPAPKSSDTEKEKWYICTSDGYYIKRTGLSTSPGIGYTTEQSNATKFGFEHRNSDGRQYVVYEYISSSNYVFLVSEEKKLKIGGTEQDCYRLKLVHGTSISNTNSTVMVQRRFYSSDGYINLPNIRSAPGGAVQSVYAHPYHPDDYVSTVTVPCYYSNPAISGWDLQNDVSVETVQPEAKYDSTVIMSNMIMCYVTVPDAPYHQTKKELRVFFEYENHQFNEKIAYDVTPATCSKTGVRVHPCCNYLYDPQTGKPDYEHNPCTAIRDGLEEEIPRLPHTLDMNKAMYHAATCTTGAYYTGTCTVCENPFATRYVDNEPALGHSYVSHAETESTCTQQGCQAYLECTRCRKTFNTDGTPNDNLTYKSIDPKAHSWGVWTIAWNDDYTATASRVCAHNCGATETNSNVVVTHETTTPPTCHSMGEETYTATLTIGGVSQAVENGTARKPLEKTEHSWSVWTIAWNDDYTATASRVCANNCGATETNSKVVVTHETTTPPTCHSMGEETYTATLTIGGVSQAVENGMARKPLEKTEHSWGAWTIAWNDDYTATASRVCANNCGATETNSKVAVTHETVQAANCTADGVERYTASVTIDGNVYGDTRDVGIGMLGHAYGPAEYTWTDDWDSVTAEMVCANNAEHKVTETVKTTAVRTKEPTCTEMGETTYTATFANAAFTPQTKTVANIPALTPTATPTATPTTTLTAIATATPTLTPAPTPTQTPTATPTPTVTLTPAPTPTPTPTPIPTATPAPTPTQTPEPTPTQTLEPTTTPTPVPTQIPEPTPVTININQCSVTVKDQTYTGKALKPAVAVTYNKAKLKEGKDYTISYNKKAKAIGAYKLTVTGKGNYSGSKQLTFNINPKGTSFSKVKGGIQQVTMTWKNPKNITGYEIQYSLKEDFKNSEKVRIDKAGILTATIKNLAAGKTYYVRIRTYKTMSKKNYFSDWSKDDTVKTAAKQVDISKCKITVKNLTYTGKAVTAKAMKAAVTVKYGKQTLECGTDYSLTYDKKLKAVGPAAVIVKGKGNYTGSRKVTFNIVPKGTAFTSLTGGKQSITLKWKNPGAITGYQIEYGLKKDFKGAEKVDIPKAKTLKTTVKKLAANKTYYVRIRTYTTVKKVNYYSAWSKVKTVKTTGAKNNSSVAPLEVSMSVGEELDLKETLEGSSWESSDETVATVSADGIVKALAKGKVVITALDANEEQITVVITVSDENVLELDDVVILEINGGLGEDIPLDEELELMLG